MKIDDRSVRINAENAQQSAGIYTIAALRVDPFTFSFHKFSAVVNGRYNKKLSDKFVSP